VCGVNRGKGKNYGGGGRGGGIVRTGKFEEEKINFGLEG